jgi:hypothetical protein
MKGRATVVAIAVAVALFAGSVAPRPARAMDDIVKVGLITSAVVGGILLIAIIGTALTRDDPRWLTETSPGMNGSQLPSRERVHFGMRCPQAGGAALAVCW